MISPWPILEDWEEIRETISVLGFELMFSEDCLKLVDKDKVLAAKLETILEVKSFLDGVSYERAINKSR